VTSPLAARLLAVAHPLPEDPARAHVPEPIVKQALASYGIAVPRPDGDRLVLKAHGPGLVHKSEAGAVQLGLAPADVESARDEMAKRLAEAGTPAGGFLVEEQLPPGPELIVGVRSTTFGPVVLLGVGGVMVEALDRAEARLAPLSEDDARDLVRAVVPREGVVDRDAVARTVVGLARFADDLGPALAEVELNPIIGGVAADARLILRVVAPADDGIARPPTDFGPLLAPRTIAVAGASTTKESFGNRFLAAYRDVGWTDGLYALHPTADAVDGVPAIASPADVPGGLDSLLLAVPAPACAPMVRAAAGHARFAHVISGGFRETGADDAEADLLAAGREAGVRVLGPNCMGVFAPAGRQAFQLAAPREAGSVAVICQSGGLAGDIIKGGDVRGVRFRAVVTIGNAVDVTPGELLAHFLGDPSTTVVGLYVEDPRDGRALVDALRGSRKPVVALVGGLSGQGAAAVASHTGALASDRRIWDAVARATGLTVVDTLEGLLASLAYLQRWTGDPSGAAAPEPAVLVVGPGGGASVLATDACDRAGLRVAKVGPDLQHTLRGMGYGTGTSVANPVEIPVGPAAPADGYHRLLEPLLAAQPYTDVLVHVNVQAYFSFGTAGAARLIETIELFGSRPPSARMVLALRNLDTAPPAEAGAITRACVEAAIPATRTLDEAAIAIAAIARRRR
jgi:acyl-CoA synthetase (NDP forming)